MTPRTRGPRAATSRRTRWPPAWREQGQVTAFVVIMMAAFLAFAGLVYDGGNALAAKTTAIDEAQEAARAGAQQINLAAFRATGQVTLDPAAAAAAAQAYVAAAGGGDTATVTVTVSLAGFRPGGTVRATITCTTAMSDLWLLRVPGSQTLTASFASVIDTYRGITATGTGSGGTP